MASLLSAKYQPFNHNLQGKGRQMTRAGLTYRLIRLMPKASRLMGPRGAPYILYLTKFELENSENVVFFKHLWHFLFLKLIFAILIFAFLIFASVLPSLVMLALK